MMAPPGVRPAAGPIRQYLMDVGELGPSLRVGTTTNSRLARRAPPSKTLQLDAQLLPEVLDDVVLHAGLGGGGEAQDGRRKIITGLLPDEASHVAVVGAEVVAPTGETVGLVQHPAADFPLLQGPAQGDAAQLFRRDQQDAGVAQSYPLQCVGAFRHGEQAVDGDAGADAAGFQPGHLVGHQGHQGRDHHGEGAGLVVAGQGGQLVAQRLARSRGQDGQRVLVRHGGLDHDLLQGPAVFFPGRLGPEIVEAEPAGQLAAGVVAFPAPPAVVAGAGGVAQSA